MKMELFAERSFKWLGDKVPCPDDNLLNKNYNFYTECEIDEIKYEIGLGVQLKIDSVQSVGIIHYFYEIPYSVPKVKKYIAALELFYKPNEISSSLATPAELDHDLEVVKKDNVNLVHVPVYVIKSRCIVVYGLYDEDPQDLLHEFMSTTSDTIYICRYIASLQDGLFYLKGAVEGTADEVKTEPNDSIIDVEAIEENNTVRAEEKPAPVVTEINSSVEYSDDEKHLTAGKYVVDHIEDNIACNIIIKLKRQVSSPEPPEQPPVPPVLPVTPEKKYFPVRQHKIRIKRPAVTTKKLPSSTKNYTVQPAQDATEEEVPLNFYGKKYVKIQPATEKKNVPERSNTIIATEKLPSSSTINNSVKPVQVTSSNLSSEINTIPQASGPKKHVPLILSKTKKTQQSPSELMRNLSILSPQNPQKRRELPSQEQVTNMNKNIKQMNKRKPILSSLQEHSDDDVIMTEINTQPVVVLNKIDLNVSPETQTSARIKTRRSSRAKAETPIVISTPTRSSRRQTPKVSYQDFYESPEKRSARTRFSKNYDDYVMASPRSTRKKSVDTDETSRKKTVEETPTKTKKSSVTFNETPKTNSVRQKRSVTSSVDVTPKKQSKIISTPRSGRLNIMTMTPTIEEREEPIVFCNTPMSRARMGLSAYTVPLKVPCRENEYLNIYNFVTGRLLDQSSGCMYISGVPGTGKTMTVCRVMNDLSNEKDEYSDFVFLKLNALALTEPRQIYVEIVKKLINKKLHWEESLKEIERFFKAKKKKVPHVILVDELDKLCNRKQDVVYNLLDLPFHSVTPLIVITIANTMDLPERILTNKVNSRLGLVRLTFKPYQYKDLVKIVTERLATDAVFKNEALELVARKVAAVSGDARRALAMCSRATEIAEEEDKELVTMDIVDKVLNEMSSSSKVQAIQCCAKLEKHILTAIANEVTRTGNEEVPFVNMMHNLEKFCVFESFKLPSPEVCLKACHNLGSFRLLITQHGKIDINMTLMLNISTDDVHYALRQ